MGIKSEKNIYKYPGVWCQSPISVIGLNHHPNIKGRIAKTMKPSISFISSSIARFIQVLFYVAAMGTPPLAVISAQSSRIAHNDLLRPILLTICGKQIQIIISCGQKMYACHLIISHSFEWTSVLVYFDFPFCLVCFSSPFARGFPVFPWSMAPGPSPPQTGRPSGREGLDAGAAGPAGTRTRFCRRRIPGPEVQLQLNEWILMV